MLLYGYKIILIELNDYHIYTKSDLLSPASGSGQLHCRFGQYLHYSQILSKHSNVLF